MSQQVPKQEQASASLSPQNVLVINSTSKAISETGSQHTTSHQVKASPSNHSQNVATIITGGVPSNAWDSSAAELSSLLLGKQLGSYLIEDSLGMGGMAAVFRAKDHHLERRVALKVLLPRLAANQEHVQRFEREAKLAAQLDSEHIARVHSYGQDQGLHYIAYEFIEGTNLKDLLDSSGGKIPIHTAIDLITQAAQGIHDAATQSITHRDIKPSNMIVTAQGKLKLLDLGLARHMDLLEENTLTHPGSTLGTFDYLSPEQAIDPRLADVRSDIYSLGCTFYHLLTGMPPVPEGTAARKLHSHQLELPRDPRELNQEINQELLLICSRMLAKNPEDRYQSASELLTALKQLTSEQGSHIELSKPIQQGNVSTIQALVIALMMLAGIVIYDKWFASDVTERTNSDSHALETSSPTGDLPSSAKLASNLKSETPISVPVSIEVSTEAELERALQNKAGGVILLKNSIYENKGLRSWHINQKWTIKPLNATSATLRLAAQSVQPMFTLSQGNLNLENIKIEVTGSDCIAIQAQHESSVILNHCEIIRKDVDLQRLDRKLNPLIRFDASPPNSAGICSLEMNKSIWHPSNSNGIEMDCSGQILIEDCSIGTQNKFVTIAGSNPAKRLIQLKNTSLAVARIATFAIHDPYQVLVDFEQCIVGAQEANDKTGTTAQAFFLLSKSNAAAFHSKNTVYYGVNIYCSLDDNSGRPAIAARNLQQLESCMQQFRDEGSLVTKRSPWVETYPWQKFSETGSINAFMVQTDFQLKGQRQENTPSSRDGSNLSNVANSKSKIRTTKVVTVDGKGMESTHYMSILQALNANSDENELSILLQINGNISLNPIDIGDRKVVIKGDEGYRPELSLQRQPLNTDEEDSSMFRIRNGELTFEFLRIRLEPARESQKLLSIASISGDGRCTIRNTVVTLRGNSNAQVCGILIDGTPSGRSQAHLEQNNGIRIECIDSIVRGRGQVIHTSCTRPFTAHFVQSGIAIDGALVAIFSKQPDPVSSMDLSTLQFEKCTSYTTNGLIWLRDSGIFPTGTPIRCQCSNSVFANSDAHPLIRLETKQNENDLKRQLQWMGKRNYYLASTGILLSHLQLERETMPTLYDSTLWGETWAQADEQAQHIKSVPLQGIIRQTALTDWESSDFLLKLDGSISIGLRDIGFPAETMPRETMPMP